MDYSIRACQHSDGWTWTLLVINCLINTAELPQRVGQVCFTCNYQLSIALKGMQGDYVCLGLLKGICAPLLIYIYICHICAPFGALAPLSELGTVQCLLKKELVERSLNKLDHGAQCNNFFNLKRENGAQAALKPNQWGVTIRALGSQGTDRGLFLGFNLEYALELLWVDILLPGYPLTNTRRVPGYPLIVCSMFPALNQDLDCRNRPTTSQDMSNFLHQSFWNWTVTSFRATLWLFSLVFRNFSRVFTPFGSTGALELLNWGTGTLELLKWGVNWLDF